MIRMNPTVIIKVKLFEKKKISSSSSNALVYYSFEMKINIVTKFRTYLSDILGVRIIIFKSVTLFRPCFYYKLF